MHHALPGHTDLGALSRLRDPQRPRLEAHFLALDSDDRVLRFNSLLSDELVVRYVNHLDFERDIVLGWWAHDGSLAAVVHLAHASPHLVEFGISVLAPFRGRGYGQECTREAFAYAAKHGYGRVHVQFIKANRRMRAIVEHFVGHEERDGNECMVEVPLPAVVIKPFHSPLQALVPVTLAA